MAQQQHTQPIAKLLCIVLMLMAILVHPPETAAQTDAQTHTVRAGETLFSIARRYSTTVSELVSLNQLLNPNLIFINQQLKLPIATENGTIALPSVHTVVRGDNLMRIAIRYRTSVTEIANLNELSDWNKIYVGQILRIPNGQPVAATPTNTPVISTSQPTAVPTTTAPQPTAVPQATSTPLPIPTNNNILNNGSFENGWYNLNNIPELQVPNGWQLSWKEGETGFGNEVWDVWVRPETRVLPANQLPSNEHALFIYDGNYTFKVFKGNGAHHTTLATDIYLEAGTYQFGANIFPDLVENYDGGQKNWASDPVAGDVRIKTGSVDSGWMLPTFGQRNSYNQQFTINQAQTVTLSVEVRGRFAIINNGWFIDHLTLHKNS